MKRIGYSGVRSTIGEYVHLVSRIAPIFITADARADQLKAYCLKHRLSYSSVLIKTAANLKHRYPIMNAVLGRGFLRKKIFFPDDVDMAVAVEKTENGEIFVTTPIIRSADKKSVDEIAAELKGMARTPFKERSDIKPILFFNLLPSFMKYFIFRIIGQNQRLFRNFFGTVGFSNLGALGVMNFFPLWPQSVTFGIGSVEEKAVVVDGSIETAPILHISLGFNHRVLDGGVAARILGEFKRMIESGEFES